MVKCDRKLLVLDNACIEWLKQQGNASLAVRKLIHAELCKLPTGRPPNEKEYIVSGVGNLED